jgi:hypothetical protein
MVFYYKYLQLLIFSKKIMSHYFSPMFFITLTFNYPKSHHHDKNNKNSKFKLTKFPNKSLS